MLRKQKKYAVLNTLRELVSVTKQTGVHLTLSETPKTGFTVTSLFL